MFRCASSSFGGPVEEKWTESVTLLAADGETGVDATGTAFNAATAHSLRKESFGFSKEALATPS